MAEIKDIAAYVLSKTEGKRKLSNARLTKIFYLSDWKRAIESRTTISGIDWYFDHFGPFVWEVINTARQHPELFAVSELPLPNREKRTLISLTDWRYIPRLEKGEREAIDHVLQVTKDLAWPEFIRLVYSTYPVAACEKYQHLDLVALADEYARYQKESKSNVPDSRS